MAMATTGQVGALLLVTGAGLAFWTFGDRDSDNTHEVSEKISTVRLDSPNADVTIKVGTATRPPCKRSARTGW
jgi:hypothetical protein